MKKKISFSKKLDLKKEAIATLNDTQRAMVAGGAKLQITKTPTCVTLVTTSC
ncbi:class I lanthipeptide [Chitinophaga sp. 22536]|uniref:class I lanthipeptide n=1 Tax=unclassified Chitinophaga TaxID=2619133 RepID=UPI003F82B1A2